MKTHLLYIIIGVLLAGNVALLLKKTPLPRPAPRQAERRELPERVVHLDSLVLRRWSDQSLLRPEFGKPTFLFFFSGSNCASCVERTVDYLTLNASETVETYIVSVDVSDSAEREAYNARFLRSLPFYTLESVRRTPEFDVGLPVLMVVNVRREILYAKQVLASDDLQGDFLFWKRINFLYSLLAL